MKWETDHLNTRVKLLDKENVGASSCTLILAPRRWIDTRMVPSGHTHSRTQIIYAYNPYSVSITSISWRPSDPRPAHTIPLLRNGLL